MQALADHPVDCVVCTGMGRRAVERLMAQGITLYRAPSASVADTIAGLKTGSLTVMDLRQACAGHEHQH
jgi:predicted Fe-Mo cluster-binding NifX family protein